MPQVAAYKGSFGAAQAERLLWRAGFGPRKGEAEALAKLGLDGAVRALANPGREQLVGPAPKDEKGRPLAPYDAWGHDHVWWLDRMVRTSRPLVERMTLVWHDWFATSNSGVGSQRLMLNQNQLFRDRAHSLFTDIADHLQPRTRGLDDGFRPRPAHPHAQDTEPHFVRHVRFSSSHPSGRTASRWLASRRPALCITSSGFDPASHGSRSCSSWRHFSVHLPRTCEHSNVQGCSDSVLRVEAGGPAVGLSGGGSPNAPLPGASPCLSGRYGTWQSVRRQGSGR